VKVFFDTNILVYAQQSGEKADVARNLLLAGGVISVQVANELANVLLKKFGRSWPEVMAVLQDVYDLLGEAKPLTFEVHRHAVELASDHQLSIYDAMILASAAAAKCNVVLSEDLQNGFQVAGLKVQNPF
jgi:predicted nucleic acid-binding protein